MVARVWAYVDAQRTHDVRAGILDAPRLRFVVRQCAFGGTDNAEVHVVSIPIETSWEGTRLVRELEARLAHLGSYWCWQTGGTSWTLLGATPVVDPPDIHPLAIEGVADVVEFHHFRHPARPRTTILVGMPHVTGAGTRFVLARVEVSPRPRDEPALTILHSRLPPVVYRSVLFAECVSLQKEGYSKETTAQTAGTATLWWKDLLTVLDGIVAKLQEGRTIDPDWRPEWRNAKGIVPVGRAGMAAAGPGAASVMARDMGGGRDYDVETEDLGRAGAAKGKAPGVMIDDSGEDARTILADPRLIALRARFLTDAQTLQILDGGERVIRDEIKRIRAKVAPREQHLVSIVEAALLVRNTLGKRGKKPDVDALRVLRHAPAYL